MKQRKSKNYLVIGNVHLGTSDDILKTLSVLAKEYNAQVIHTGNICTYTEKAMHDRRIHKLRTFENIGQEKLQAKLTKIDTEAKHISKDLKDLTPLEKVVKTLAAQIRKINAELTKFAKNKRNHKDSYDAKTREKIQKKKEELAALKKELKANSLDLNKNLRLLERRDTLLGKKDLMEDLNESKREQLLEEIELLTTAEAARVQKLKAIFPNIQLIANDEQKISDYKEIIGDSLTLSKYLDIESVNANGDRVTSTPITDKSFRYLKQKHKSTIMPHPAPSLRSYERAGLNEAWNMYTTGCLFDVSEAKRPSEFYKATYMPSALLVTVDDENGEFHASRLHIDRLRCDFAKKVKPVILQDGRCFSPGGIVEVSGSDRAVYSTDDHAPHEHTGVLGVVRALQSLSKAETFINGGDAGDWTSLCPHNKNKPRSAENLRFHEDKAAVKRMMEAQGESKYLTSKVLIDANHEYWLERYVDENPAMEGMVDQPTVYAEIIPDWEYHISKNGEDYTYYFGDIAIRHGHKESLPKATKMFTKYLAGHFHSHNEYLRCASAGAGAKLGPKYLEGNLTKWQNCSTTLTRYKGVTAFEVKSILHTDSKSVSRFSWQGKIYEVKWHKYS